MVFHEPGGPEKLKLETFPDPKPGPGEAVVKVRACALNHLDIWILSGIPAYKISLPHAMGCDVSGIVESVGTGVAAVSPGTEVIVAPLHGCGECDACRGGRDNLCSKRSVLGAGARWGGYAERVCVPAGDLLPKPPVLSFEEAAAFPLTFLTSWHMLMTLAGLKSGQSVLILGAGSGVGAAAIAIAKYAGARILATASLEEKRKKASELGADITLDHTNPEVWKQVRESTGGKGVDVVFEHIGSAVFKQALQCLAHNGVLVTCGSTTGADVSLDLRFVFSRQLSIRGAYLGTRQELDAILELFNMQKLQVVVDSTFRLERAPQALERLLSRKGFGKIVLTHEAGG